MLLGFNGATTLTADLATDIRAARAAGYGCLEIWAPKLLGYFANGSLTDLRRALRRADLPATTLNSVERVTFQDPSGHERMLQDFTRFCRVASALGRATVLAVPSPKPKGMTRTGMEAETVRVLRQLGAIAAPSLDRSSLSPPGPEERVAALPSTFPHPLVAPFTGKASRTFGAHELSPRHQPRAADQAHAERCWRVSSAAILSASTWSRGEAL